MLQGEVWVTHAGREWEFSEQLSEINCPSVFHLLKAAVKTFQLPENDAYVQLQYKKQTVSNRKALESLFETNENHIEFELVHLAPKCSYDVLAPTKFLSPLDFIESKSCFNDEAMMVTILFHFLSFLCSF